MLYFIAKIEAETQNNCFWLTINSLSFFYVITIKKTFDNIFFLAIKKITIWKYTNNISVK